MLHMTRELMPKKVCILGQVLEYAVVDLQI
jgi:hypothetical protein